jgi:hypothetical protein
VQKAARGFMNGKIVFVQMITTNERVPFVLRKIKVVMAVKKGKTLKNQKGEKIK